MNEIYTVMSNWGGIGDELLNLKHYNTINFNKLWLCAQLRVSNLASGNLV